MARKHTSNLLCIILAFTVTRYDAALLGADHEFRRLKSFDDVQLEERLQLTMVGSYSNDMAPKACSTRLFFSISNINVSPGSDSFLVSHQSTLNTHTLRILYRSRSRHFTLPSVDAEKNSVPDFDCNQSVLYAGSRWLCSISD